MTPVLRATATICVVAAFAGAWLVFQLDPIVSRPLRSARKEVKVVEAQAGDFFVRRNNLVVTVPWDMTVTDFVQLYQLQQTLAELVETLQVGGDPARVVLKRGQRLSVQLTPPVRP